MAQNTKKDPRKEIKLSLRTKIIALILLLVSVIMAFVYSTILKDERLALTDLTVSGGGAIATTLAINSWNVFNDKLLKEQPDGNFTEDTYAALDYFDINFTESLDQLVQQKDIVYAVVVNKFGRVVSHSKQESRVKEMSLWTPLPGIRSYKELFRSGAGIKFIAQDYSGAFYNPKTGQNDTGEIIDISFPILSNMKNAQDLSLYEGEVHLGISKDSIFQVLRNAKAKLQGVSALSVLFGILGAIILAALIISPILKLVQAMGKVAMGDMKQRVQVRTQDEIQLLANSFNRMIDGLSKYVSAGLVTKLMGHQDALTLGGSNKRVTIMESDIRNFTGTSENMTPAEIVEYLNEYLDIMSKVVLKFGGEIDKYIGDAILAHFGLFDATEESLAEHTKNAVRATVAMNQALIPFNEKRQQQGRHPIRFGVGINTGEVTVGNIGSTERMDYTVIGDNMNLTARICDHAGKDFKEENGNVVHLRNILITESTYELVKDIVVVEDKFVHLKVKGKVKPVKVFQVYDVREG
jgi:class 3 adenylate cyclase